MIPATTSVSTAGSGAGARGIAPSGYGSYRLQYSVIQTKVAKSSSSQACFFRGAVAPTFRALELLIENLPGTSFLPYQAGLQYFSFPAVVVVTRHAL